MEKAEEVAELQQLRSTLSLTYGPLGVYVILHLHKYILSERSTSGVQTILV